MRLAVLALPFKTVSTWLGREGQTTPVEALDPQQAQFAVRVARAIHRIQPFTPWDSNCLAQALTARKMLQRRGIPCTTYLGAAVQADRSGLIAHAWLRCGPWILTGGKERRRYKVVATFA